MYINYGCKPPVKDVRDFKLSKSAVDEHLPVAYIPNCLPPVKNQRSVSSCVAHATSSILEYHDLKAGRNTLSTNFIYGIQKQLCGHDGSGMYLRDACKIAKDYGDMLEDDCPGNTEVPECWEIAENAVNDANKVTKAGHFKIKSYFSCSNADDIKRALYKYGPVLGSIKWYRNYECDKDGVLRGVQKGDYGHHAIMIYGWNATGFLCQNSWGTLWNGNGGFILPYDIPFADAKGFVDADDTDLIKPRRGTFVDYIYKIVNYLLNLFKK